MFKELNEAIDNAHNVSLKDGASWWFDREHQRRYIFQIQTQLVIHGTDPDLALELAEETVQRYFERHVQTSTRINY